MKSKKESEKPVMNHECKSCIYREKNGCQGKYNPNIPCLFARKKNQEAQTWEAV